jgi:hypothetical protein
LKLLQDVQLGSDAAKGQPGSPVLSSSRPIGPCPPLSPQEQLRASFERFDEERTGKLGPHALLRMLRDFQPR